MQFELNDVVVMCALQFAFPHLFFSVIAQQGTPQGSVFDLLFFSACRMSKKETAQNLGPGVADWHDNTPMLLGFRGKLYGTAS